MIEDCSVCITSFKRAQYLERALVSVVGQFSNIVVVDTGGDPGVRELSKHRYFQHVKWHFVDADLGCAETWLQCAYHSPTDRMILLHNDDEISPEFEKHYVGTIKPWMDSGSVEFCSWRAHLKMDDGSIKPTEWFSHGTSALPSSHITTFLLRLGRLSLSPIISIFRRNTLIKAVKEGNWFLYQHQQCLHHQSMLLGTEIIAYLRHAADHPRWGFVNEVLSYYGCCNSSGTVKVQKTGNLACITKGYDIARQYFLSGKYEHPVLPPKVLLVYDDFLPADAGDQQRINTAYRTWQYQFDQADVIEVPTTIKQWSKTSAELGDERPVPYFHDLIQHGVDMAQSEDVVAYCNRDIQLTSNIPELILEGVKRHGIILGRRREFTPEPGRIYKTFKGGKKDGGIDLICITPKWWNEHWKNLPRMFIGREGYDWVLWSYAEKVHGPTIYLDDGVGHQNHASYWRKNKRTNPAQAHNRALAKVFFARAGDRRALMSLA